tara:strand:- start:603 stop:719 length:117 start_codon:yes stop_codon:yes gene_type:complete
MVIGVGQVSISPVLADMAVILNRESASILDTAAGLTMN